MYNRMKYTKYETCANCTGFYLHRFHSLPISMIVRSISYADPDKSVRGVSFNSGGGGVINVHVFHTGGRADLPREAMGPIAS